MFRRPKLASRSYRFFACNNSFRRVVLGTVLVALLLPNVALARASAPALAPAAADMWTPGTAEANLAEFIIGPQAAVSSSWFDTTQINRAKIHGAQCPVTPPTEADPLNSFVLLHYYDLPLTQYIAYQRTKDPLFLTYAQKCADSWWRHPQWIMEGAQRDFPNGRGPAPRHGGIGGLILRAMDGRPEMWDWINAYTRFSFDLWLKRRINDSKLYYGVREGAFALHYAVWLAKVLPDSFPLQAGGTVTNGAALRAQYLADVEAITTNYFARLQFADGSWRWDDVDFVDSDGGTLKGISQPFMVGLLLNALIDVHRLTTNTVVKASIQDQLTKACRHLYEGGPYRKDEAVVGLTGKRWRSFWYFYHGGTTVNPTRYQNGGGSYREADQNWIVKSERQGISTIFSAYGYTYMITGDPIFKTMGDDLFEAAFENTVDGIRDEADGTAKNYNQNYRMGGRYLVWRQGGGVQPSPSPTPTPSSSPSPSPSPSATPTPSPSPTPTPTPTPAPQASASFVQADVTTKGNWKSNYGGDGYNTINNALSYPSYAQVNVSSSTTATWTASTTDVRALQKVSASDRVAARWESTSFFSIEVNLTDNQTHRVALYNLDWDGNNRQQRIDVIDWATGALLDSRNISAFNGGQYLVWNVRGRVKFTVNRIGARTAVISGLYFGNAVPTPTPTPTPSPSPTPTPSNGAPQVTLTVPTNGQTFVAGTDITLAANASDPGGAVTKVDFFRSGTLIGTDTTAPFSIVWTNPEKGNYDLTARATDDSGLSTTSAVVSISVTNSPNSVGKARGRAGSLVQQTQQTQEYAGAADAVYSENTLLASDLVTLTKDIEKAYVEFQSEVGSFGSYAAAIDDQINAADLFSKATHGLALRAASSPNIVNNLMRIAAHLAIAEDLMRYARINQATMDQARSTKTRTSLTIGFARTGYSMSTIAPVAPGSIGSISGTGNVEPMSSQTAFAPLLANGTLPYEVAGLSVTVGGVAVPVLYVSPWGIKFYVPTDMQAGSAEVVVTSQDGYVCRGSITIGKGGSRVMTAVDDDNGVAVVQNSHKRTTNDFDVTSPENLGADKRTRLIIFATGISAGASNTNITNDLTVDGKLRPNFAESVSVEARLSDGRVFQLPVEFAGAQGVLPGLDQINVILVPELRGGGNVQLTLVIAGQRSNSPTVSIR